MKSRVFWDVAPCSHVELDRRFRGASFTWTVDSYITCYPFTHDLFIALMMEAVRISETSVHFNVTTRRYIPEDSKFQTLFLCDLYMD
jgi:hypothetical protein